MPPALEESPSNSTRTLAFHGSLKPTGGGLSPTGHGTGRSSVLPATHYPGLLSHVSTLGAPARAVANPAFTVLLNSFPQPRLQAKPGSSAVNGYQDGIPQAALSTTSSTAGLSRPDKSLPSTMLAKPSTSLGKRGRRPFKNVPSTEPILNKRGRSCKNHGAVSSADQLPKKRGRPFKSRHDFRDVTPAEPKFIPFICEWRKCPAELHNLETLRAHIFTVHNKRQPSGTLTCLWANCSTPHMARSPAVVDKHFEFKKKQEWQNHIEKSHLVPISWHMGDGPKGTSLVVPGKSKLDASASWLSDVNGQQVTPSVKDQPIEDGRARDNNAKRFVKKREGLYFVLDPIQTPEVYLKTENYDDYDDEGDILSTDELG